MVNNRRPAISEEEKEGLFRQVAREAIAEVGQQNGNTQLYRRIFEKLLPEELGYVQDVFDAVRMELPATRSEDVSEFWKSVPQEEKPDISLRRTINYRTDHIRQEVSAVMNNASAEQRNNGSHAFVQMPTFKAVAYRPAAEAVADIIHDLNIEDRLKTYVTELVGRFLLEAEETFLDNRQYLVTTMKNRLEDVSQTDYITVTHSVFRVLTSLHLMQRDASTAQLDVRELADRIAVCAAQASHMCAAVHNREGMISPQCVAAKCKNALRSAGLSSRYGGDLNALVKERLLKAKMKIGTKKKNNDLPTERAVRIAKPSFPVDQSASRAPAKVDQSFSFTPDPDRDLAIGHDTESDEDFEEDPAWEESLLDVNPYLPSDAKPGSEDKVKVLAARYYAGIPLWNGSDRFEHTPSPSEHIQPELSAGDEGVESDEEDAPIDMELCASNEETMAERVTRETVQAALRSSDGRIVIPPKL